MMHTIKITLQKFLKKVIHFIHLQLFLTVLSLPVLAYWGLPLSLLSPFGNFIFGPVVALFLLLSSFLFFAELLYLPTWLLAFLLDFMTKIWLTCLSYGSTYWLVAYQQPPLLVCIAMVFITSFCFYYYRLSALYWRIGLLGLLLSLFIAFFIYFLPLYSTTSVSCAKKAITCIKTDQGIIIPDLSPVAALASPEKWIEYTLMSHLTQHYGTLIIHAVIIPKITTRTIKALVSLCTVTQVKTIYLITWQGTLSPNLAFVYRQLKTITTQKDIIIKRISHKSIKIPLSKKNALTITPIDRISTYKNIQFNHVDITIDSL